MVMLIKNLGPDYSVWDKAAQIRFLRPGVTDLFAEFTLTENDIDTIKKTVQENGKMDWFRKVEIKDKNGHLVAEVDKVISIKPRNRG